MTNGKNSCRLQIAETGLMSKENGYLLKLKFPLTPGIFRMFIRRTKIAPYLNPRIDYSYDVSKAGLKSRFTGELHQPCLKPILLGRTDGAGSHRHLILDFIFIAEAV